MPDTKITKIIKIYSPSVVRICSDDVIRLGFYRTFYQTYGMRRYFTRAIYASYPGSSCRSTRSSRTARNAIPTTRISPSNPYRDPSIAAYLMRKQRDENRRLNRKA